MTVGMIAIDRTKVHTNASHHSNLDYEQLAWEILKEAGEFDAAEDELHGDTRGDELPEHLQTREGRDVPLWQRPSAARARARQERCGRRGKGSRGEDRARWKDHRRAVGGPRWMAA